MRRRWHQPSVSLGEQLALYETFHRDPRNRRIHYATLPFILGSGFALAATFVPAAGPVVCALAALAFLVFDPLGTALLAAWVVPLMLAASDLARHFDAVFVVVGGLGVQLAGWFLSVGIGHERYEAALELGSRRVSSNVYLERQMFRLQNVGRRAGAFAAAVQFLIAPFHMTMRALFHLGYRPALRDEVARLVAENLHHLSREEPLLAPRG